MPPVSPPLTAEETLQREWLPLRARLLEVAATLDRLDRTAALPADSAEARTVDAAVRTLLDPGAADRAERLQRLFSRAYDPGWRERFAAGETSADGPTGRVGGAL